MDISSLAALAVFFLMSFAAASSGAIFRPGAWYEQLAKPSWTPPKWAFPVVWTILFCAIAVSGWLIWERAGAGALAVLGVFVAHLVVNAAWSGFFFGANRLDWAMADVVLLWLMIAALIALFYPIHTLAALLLVPYLIWVSIAAALNFRILQLNGPRG